MTKESTFVITDKGIFKFYNMFDDLQIFYPNGEERWCSIHTHIKESFQSAVKRYCEERLKGDYIIKHIKEVI